jgi:RNA polymerase sigma-70 factor (ECF subfamily)
MGMSGDPATELVELYDHALPQIYGYLLSRCGQAPVAQDLTAETFLAAVKAVQSGAPPSPLSTAWLVGVARHKLVDHWRRAGREERNLQAVGEAVEAAEAQDPWETRLDALAARATLERLAPSHRAVLTLRYVDDLPVAEVATLLGRSLHATEALLMRAKAAFRREYTPPRDGSDG